MRDMPGRKFETACRHMGFNPVPGAQRHHGAPVFESDDGLHVAAALHCVRHPHGKVRVHRRRTLARMSEARKGCPRAAGRLYAGAASVVWALDPDPNEEAPGAGTPRASV